MHPESQRLLILGSVVPVSETSPAAAPVAAAVRGVQSDEVVEDLKQCSSFAKWMQTC